MPTADPENLLDVDRWVLAVIKDGPEALEALHGVVDDRMIAMPDVLRLSLLRGARENA